MLTVFANIANGDVFSGGVVNAEYVDNLAVYLHFYVIPLTLRQIACDAGDIEGHFAKQIVTESDGLIYIKENGCVGDSVVAGIGNSKVIEDSVNLM